MQIIPRIQRIFHCKELVVLQEWHASHISDPWLMWVSTDSLSMKHMEDTWLDKFKDKVQSLQMSIVIDGVNPHFLQNTNYYVWLVVVINNNIPRWFSENNEYLMLALIFSCRRHVNWIDVFLQLLINELKQLWEGSKYIMY
jgi:hypothetical protein